MASTIRLGQNRGYILPTCRLGQDGGYTLITIGESQYIEPPNPLRGYVFIGDPGS